MFEIILSQRARKASKKQPDHYRRKIIDLLLILRENPVPAEYYDIKKLKGCVDTYRARLGNLRIIYEIIWNQRVVNILLIEPRETAYS